MLEARSIQTECEAANKCKNSSLFSESLVGLKWSGNSQLGWHLTWNVHRQGLPVEI